MTLRRTLCTALLATTLLAPAVLFSAEKMEKAARAKQYQVTGEVLAVEDTMVTVQKGDEKWEINLAANTKSEGKMKVGDKVLIHYHMTANSVEVK
jgi:high-affinity Fe2+/Pb2+ permease